MQYVIRSCAMRFAKSLGWHYFRTVQHPLDRTWSAKQVHTSATIDFSWCIGKDFVAWHEVHQDENGQFHPVLIVSCTREELVDEAIPDHFIVEPQTPELFEPQTASRTRSVKSHEPKAERAKSDVASPTKLVWQIADSMPNASRADVIAACVAKGVNAATASTQFSKWRKARS